MLFINRDVMEAVLDKRALIDQMEAAMRLFATSQIAMPKRSHLEHGPNALLLMPCFGKRHFCTKLVSIFPGNQGGELPVVNGMVLLSDGETGAPVAILDGQALTGIRTGAVGGVGIRHLTPETPQVLGLVGCGVQGFHQVRFTAAERKLNAVWLFNRDAGKIPAFMERLSNEPELHGVPLYPANDTDELLKQSNTIVLATASERAVLPESKDLFKNKTLIGVGSYRPDMQEFPEAAFADADLMMLDTPHARHESGDVVIPLEKGWIDAANVLSMGRFLCHGEGTKEKTVLKDRIQQALKQDRTLIYKSVGMAAFDLMAAEWIYTQAKERGLGQSLSL